jgi:hypothetical protein
MMKCDYCNKMTPMPALRFIPDGKVYGTVNTPKHRAKCIECMKKDFQPQKEISDGSAPF